ncbi:N-acetylglucosamine-6-phosphate deacetylase [Rhodobacter ferrooxidans]|uniref:N-acetylglucosamine-6-phosphate deacetylase n=1 Tax=Rhodobacter ferrooxidans TaxID=371731 RepID=C8RWZ2_9RHOB|nr:N-acetylglucosamine-6-phosphate deacetylase [Rhodobacter sp. SW2]EEW26517.1 N-acetylglucosamine-6-phosphate deacetylase [Rhodobacter sp. SW2]
MSTRIFLGARVFDGTRLQEGKAVLLDGGLIVGIVDAAALPPGEVVQLAGGILAPGLLDLQVNGSGGVMVNGHTDLAALQAICGAQASLGALGVLPTLITDTPQATAAVIAAGIAAARAEVPGFLGLHLEGPHLDPRRKGAHDPALIRPMQAEDLARLCDAAKALPALMLTVAPESVTPEQIAALAAAGAVVSLGHSDCTSAQAQAAMAAGATCVTHLFNAMSQMSNRAPGLVGAALSGSCHIGLIADGLHVDPAVMRVALAARPTGVFLVSDCMAVAATDLTEITLGGRRILRRDRRLTLEDGTLAGADLTLPQAMAVLVTRVGIAPERALAMATSEPAAVIGAAGRLGHLAPGRAADMVHLTDDWRLGGIWRGGNCVEISRFTPPAFRA